MLTITSKSRRGAFGTRKCLVSTVPLSLLIAVGTWCQFSELVVMSNSNNRVNGFGLQEFLAPPSSRDGKNLHTSDQIIAEATVVDKYPEHPTALDPYANVPASVQSNWASDCGGSCGPWWKCATANKHAVKSVRESLVEWIRITDALGITTISSYGSLIASLYRNSTMMRWDTDVDILIWAHDTEKLEAYSSEYNKQQERFRLVLQPEWRHKYDMNPPEGKRKYHKDDDVDWVTPNLRLVDKTTNLFIDVWAMYADDYGPEDGASHADNCTTVQLLESSEESYVQAPREWIFPLQSCYLEGIKMACPSRGGLFLTKLYGADVTEPNHRLDVSTGCWNSNAGISCGRHNAADCRSCPQGHGAVYCNGDCRWSDTADECVSKYL